MKAYLTILKMRFAVQLQYRAAAAAAFFTQLFFGFIMVMVFRAFYASSDMVQPMSLQQAITYAWLGQATLRMQPWNSDQEVLALVRSGNVAYELCRPLDLYFLWFCRLIALRLVPSILTGIPLFTMVYFLPGDFGPTAPVSAAAGIAWMVSTVMALLLGCSMTNLVAISSLWTIAGDGMQRIFPVFIMIFSGLIVPLAFFPDEVQQLLRLLPFAGLADIPYRFYLGMIPPSDIFSTALLQISWTVAFVIIGEWLFAKGMRRIVVQGG